MFFSVEWFPGNWPLWQKRTGAPLQTRQYPTSPDICKFLIFLRMNGNKLTFRRIHWQRRTMVQPRTCMSPSFTADQPRQQQQKNYTSPWMDMKKKKTQRRIQAIPRGRRRVQSVGTGEETRVKCVCSVSGTQWLSADKSLRGGLSCSGPPHVAHPWRSSPLRLDVWLEVCAQAVREAEAQSGSHWGSPVLWEADWWIWRDEISLSPPSLSLSLSLSLSPSFPCHPLSRSLFLPPCARHGAQRLTFTGINTDQHCVEMSWSCRWLDEEVTLYLVLDQRGSWAPSLGKVKSSVTTERKNVVDLEIKQGQSIQLLEQWQETYRQIFYYWHILKYWFRQRWQKLSGPILENVGFLCRTR